MKAFKEFDKKVCIDYLLDRKNVLRSANNCRGRYVDEVGIELTLPHNLYREQKS